MTQKFVEQLARCLIAGRVMRIGDSYLIYSPLVRTLRLVVRPTHGEIWSKATGSWRRITFFAIPPKQEM